MVGIHLIQFPHFGAVRFDDDLDAVGIALDLAIPKINVVKMLSRDLDPE